MSRYPVKLAIFILVGYFFALGVSQCSGTEAEEPRQPAIKIDCNYAREGVLAFAEDNGYELVFAGANFSGSETVILVDRSTDAFTLFLFLRDGRACIVQQGAGYLVKVPGLGV